MSSRRHCPWVVFHKCCTTRSFGMRLARQTDTHTHTTTAYNPALHECKTPTAVRAGCHRNCCWHHRMCTFWTLDLSKFLNVPFLHRGGKRLAASLIEGVFREETRGCDSSWTSDGDELLSVSSEGSRRRARFYCSARLMEVSSQAADRKTETAAMQESFRGENKNSWIWTDLSICRPEALLPCVTATELRGVGGPDECWANASSWAITLIQQQQTWVKVMSH